MPFGKYKAPYFPERELTAFLDKLRGCDVTFAVQDFRSTFAALRPGDVVYCDPPYAPVSATANFTSYTGGGSAFRSRSIWPPRRPPQRSGACPWS